MKAVDLSQISLSIAAVVSDRGVDAAAAHGCEEDHQRAEAIAEDGNRAGAIGQFSRSVKGILDIPDAHVAVIGLIQAEAVLPVSIRGDVEVNARLLAPE